MDSKKCGACEEEKPLDQFYKHKDKDLGVDGQCKDCTNDYNNEWKGKNKEKVAQYGFRSRLRTAFGITEEQYNELLEKQNNSCALCKKNREHFDRRFAVDHDHQSGEIRGLLCFYCNHKLIGRHRDADLLRRMADYVSQGTGWFVPKKKKTVKRKPKR